MTLPPRPCPSPPPPPTHPSRGTATGLPPPARGRSRECTACSVVGTAIEHPPGGLRSSRSALKSNQIKSNQISHQPPHPNCPPPPPARFDR